MRSKHLSYKRAIETCLSNQDLIGARFTPGAPDAGEIARVMIAPYNKILQWQFLKDVFNGADPDKALMQCRDGKYDVILISETYNPADIRYRPKSLQVHRNETGLAMDAQTGDTGVAKMNEAIG